MKKTRLEILLAASKRARKLLDQELAVLNYSYRACTGRVDAHAKPLIKKYERAISKLNDALAAYGSQP